MKKKGISQTQFIEQRLIKYGYITRNECLKEKITRLGALICKIRKELPVHSLKCEYKKRFFWKRENWGDEVYILVNHPKYEKNLNKFRKLNIGKVRELIK